jgi:hypothetical protein
MCVSRIDRLVYTNAAMRSYLGYVSVDGDEMVGPTLVELSDQLIHPDDRARTREAFRGLFAGLSSCDSVTEETVRTYRKPGCVVRPRPHQDGVVTTLT